MRNLPFLQGFRVDGYLQVTDEEAIACARQLASEEGIFGRILEWRQRCGRVANCFAQKRQGQTIVTLALRLRA